MLLPDRVAAVLEVLHAQTRLRRLRPSVRAGVRLLHRAARVRSARKFEEGRSQVGGDETLEKKERTIVYV